MKHTQGEWESKQYAGKNFITGSGYDIALIKDQCPKEEVQANAKLIAAAPDLLEALLEAQAVLANVETHYYGSEKEGERIDALINKAIKKTTT